MATPWSAMAARWRSSPATAQSTGCRCPTSTRQPPSQRSSTPTAAAVRARPRRQPGTGSPTPACICGCSPSTRISWLVPHRPVPPTKKARSPAQTVTIAEGTHLRTAARDLRRSSCRSAGAPIPSDPAATAQLRDSIASVPEDPDSHHAGGDRKNNSILKMLENSLSDGALYSFRNPATGAGDDVKLTEAGDTRGS
jgi:hypothetical protein